MKLFWMTTITMACMIAESAYGGMPSFSSTPSYGSPRGSQYLDTTELQNSGVSTRHQTRSSDRTDRKVLFLNSKFVTFVAVRLEELIPNAAHGMRMYMDLPTRIHPSGERVFVFSPHLLRWAAYDREGYQIAAGKANGGANYCPELKRPCHTPSGAFRVQRKGTVHCVSRKFPLGVGGAPMPYCMYFGSGYAIHGSPYISNNNTSHGCIRVYVGAAAWLHRYFMKPGTKVLVLSY